MNKQNKKHQNDKSIGEKLKTKVLIFCVEFWEWSHLTRDLSQAEKKITVITS